MADGLGTKVSGLCCLEVAAQSSSHCYHTHIPSQPLLAPPLHACAYAHAHTHKPTHALAAAPSQWPGELNLPETHTLSPSPANLGHDEKIETGISWSPGVMGRVSARVLLLHTDLPTPHSHCLVSYLDISHPSMQEPESPNLTSVIPKNRRIRGRSRDNRSQNIGPREPTSSVFSSPHLHTASAPDPERWANAI